MKPILIVFILLSLSLPCLAKLPTPYVSSKNGVTLFCLGGPNPSLEQPRLDADLDFMLPFIHKPDDLKIFIMLGDYGVYAGQESKTPDIFITVAYDSLTNTDTLYNEAVLPNPAYPTSFWPPADSCVKGLQGLKIRYYNVVDTVDYYNELLSIVTYSIKHLEEIKKGQQRLCFPASQQHGDISILTYDTLELNSLPVTNYGFAVDPAKRRYDTDNKYLRLRAICRILGILVGGIYVLVRIRRFRRNRPESNDSTASR